MIIRFAGVCPLVQHPITTRQSIVEFLTSFKVAMEYGQFCLKHRDKNLQALVDLGLTIVAMKEVLAELAVENYVAGPVPDDTDDTKQVWTFGYDLNGKEIFIKLRLSFVPGKKGFFTATVWSFHEAEHKLRYPYGEK